MKRTLSLLAAAAIFATTSAQAANITLLNASYDPTRELYKDLGDGFSAQWKAKTGEDLKINQSHGGS